MGDASDAGRPIAVPPRWQRSRWLPAWWPWLVPLVIVLAGAWAYRWVDEDAFIDFRIVHNLLAGHGPVFNVGERVEVDSDPLWVACLVVMRAAVPFVTVAWLSVVLGLACTAAAFACGGAAVHRLGSSRGDAVVLPIGLLIVSSVAGVWEFATSGLEMSMVFLWIALSTMALIGVHERRRRVIGAAVIMGLGPLIRPELVPASAVFVVALLVAVGAAGRGGRRHGRWRQFGIPVLAALALPLAYQVFRMGYYALLVPNTGLAKTAGSSWWSQGFVYLWNFIGPYWLWVPLALALGVSGSRTVTWWRAGDRMGVLLVVTPIVAGMTDLVYVVFVGGDYMHARLLLPAFFGICLPLSASARQIRSVMVIPLVGIAAWAVVCVGWLRYGATTGSLDPHVVFISNERNNWVAATGVAHPVTTADYRRALSGRAGTLLARTADHLRPGSQRMLVIVDPYAPVVVSKAVPASTALPVRLVVNVPAIGVIGDLVGPNVYLFDTFSLANPIGSHVTVPVHGRPGHEKEIGPAWMVARFGVAGDGARAPGAGGRDVAAARAALSCGSLRPYLGAITAPLTPARFLSDMVHSWTYTTMSFSSDPVVAERQLCDGARHRGRRLY